ncbi:hypothetical protein [uncultured Imperialibacter sp.]|uniref:hypothetical protein n=1 Tax=uncultured Imperialibacter sp. TaxID=1672639 RepID=UPI0030D839FA|tara:strand:+ start:1731 stop:3008 length:1278 start_codon:yes stop_codon:yes gene_type:complete
MLYLSTSKKLELIEGLKDRLDNIEEACTLAQLSDEGSDDLKDLYYEIAFLVEFIVSSHPLNEIFFETLSYPSSIRVSKGYKESVAKVESLLVTVVRQLKGHSDFESFLKVKKHGWKNPFLQTSGLITIELDYLFELITSEISNHNDFATFKDISGLLDAILESWYHALQSEFSIEFASDYHEFKQALGQIEYSYEFKRDYIYYDSAEQLRLIYNSVNPSKTSQNSLESLAESFIKSGKYSNAKELYSHSKKVVKHLKHRLTSQLSKSIVVDRFITFIELYFEKEVIDEKVLQKEFERFAFLNGYYPVSEAQLSNGRFDNIVSSEDASFLVEHKIFQGADADKLLAKAKKGKIQANIYKKRLEQYPNISQDVYVLIFTDLYSEFKDGISHLDTSNIRFHFYLVNLGKTKPSKIQTSAIIDIYELME